MIKGNTINSKKCLVTNNIVRVSLASSDFFILFFLLCGYKNAKKILLCEYKDAKQQRITPLHKLSHWSTPVHNALMYNYLDKRKDESNK